MNSLSQMLSDGGPFMFVLVLLGVLGVAALAAQCIGPLRSRDLGPVIRGVLVATLAVGLLGTLMGLSATFQASAQASEATRTMLVLQGSSISLITMNFALLITAPQMIVAGALASRRASMRPGASTSRA